MSATQGAQLTARHQALLLSTLPATALTTLEQGNKFSGTELSGVTAQQIKSYKEDFVTSWNMSNIDFNYMKEVLGYEGFDPDRMYAHLILKKRDHNLSENKYSQELGLLLCIQHIKGNVTQKNFKTLKPKGQQFVNYMMKRWGLQVAAKDDKADAMTISRVAMCHPMASAITATKIYKDFTGPFGSGDLAPYFKSTSFGSLIPTGEHCSLLILVGVTTVHSDLAFMISGKNALSTTKEDRETVVKSVAKFVNASFNSGICDSATRKGAMDYFNVRDQYAILAALVKKLGLADDIVCTQKQWDDCFDSFATPGALLKKSMAEFELALEQADISERTIASPPQSTVAPTAAP